MAFSIRPIAAALAAAVLISLAGASAQAADAPPGQVAKLRKAVTVAGMMRHEQALQDIATANGGTRASGTPGYEASVDYVVGKLEARATTRSSSRSTSRSSRSSPRRRSSARRRTRGPTSGPRDFATMTYSGSGDVTANVQEVDDNQFPPGPDAELVQRGL